MLDLSSSNREKHGGGKDFLGSLPSVPHTMPVELKIWERLCPEMLESESPSPLVAIVGLLKEVETLGERMGGMVATRPLPPSDGHLVPREV